MAKLANLMISKHRVKSYNELCFARRAAINCQRGNMFPKMDIPVRPRELLINRVTALDI